MDNNSIEICVFDLEELVAIGQVVMGDMNVTALLIIVATVVVAPGDGRPLLGIGSHEVDLWVGVDLCLLQGGQLRSVKSLSLVRSERATQLPTAPSTANSMGAGGFSGALTGFSAEENRKVVLLVHSLSGILKFHCFPVCLFLTCLHCAPWTGWTLQQVYCASDQWSHCSGWLPWL